MDSNKEINCLDDIKHTFYINLEHRTDRRTHVENQLATLGLSATRFNAIKMENGAVGCSMSHLKILQNAVTNNLDHVLILEDDIQFLNPDVFKAQFNKFIQIHKNDWDVILFAGNNMPPYETIDDTCIKVKKCQTTTGYLVNGHYIKVLMQNVKMGITNLIHRPAQHSLYAIDKFWFALQNIGKWYLITPVTVIQQEGYSDIEKKRTNYSRIMMDVDKHWIQRQNIQNIQNTQNNIEYNRKSNLFNGNFKNMAELQ
jgi:glycosyl transferase family 25